MDCALSLRLCADFGISGYPSLWLGPPAAFAARRPGPALKPMPGSYGRDGAGVVAWVAAELRLPALAYAEPTAEQLATAAGHAAAAAAAARASKG